MNRGPVDRRLLRYAQAARGYLVVTVALGLAGTVLILAQAGLLAHGLATAARGDIAAALTGTLIALLVVVILRAAVSYGGEVTALRAAAAVKSQLRSALTARALRLGPGWLGGQRAGEIATLSTRGLDGLDSYFARYLPQLVLGVLVPIAVVARVAVADWISAVVIAVTLPLIPVFAMLVGWHTKAQTRRQWRLLAILGGHFLDVVEGLPTLKVFGRARAQEQVIAKVTDDYRKTTMATLRVAFLSALVLELTAAVATALVAVEVGLRLLYGHLGAAGAAAHPGGISAAARGRRPVPREHGRGSRGRARVRDPGHRAAGWTGGQARPSDCGHGDGGSAGRRAQARRNHGDVSRPATARSGRDRPDHRTG
jgi:ABC-type transport system involved in cytochrome bd biosynthesis fused ATPase/permease subunit